MAYPQIPARLLREGAVEWNLMGNQITPGQTASGVLQSIRTDGGGLWDALLASIVLHEDDDHRAFRALRNLANGGASPIVVPRHDIIQPWPIVGGVQVKSYPPISFDDGSPFSDGSTFSQDVIDVVTVGDAAFRDTQLTMVVNNGSAFRGGEAFSIQHPTQDWRLYEISSVALDGFGNQVVSFLPPLREAVPSGTQVEFDLPRCLMRLKTLDAAHYRIDAPFIATQSMEFIEHFV